ncbi:uncharacterized protein [Chelonus insularis]|uniref:uncharacterized protein isoform X2 n=1 Tax=Chelonus insularis TaxID=460826 RepID=UPI00158A52CC|nr:uncharacterized protein LOC118067757 isoform X2 [Chelonus insularis]
MKMKEETRLTLLSSSTLFLLIGIITTINGDTGLPLDSFSTNSSTLNTGVEPTSQDVAKNNEAINSTQQVYPVYSSYPNVRSNVVSKKPVDTYSRMNIKPSMKDSYLEALEYSHKSKDPREGVFRISAKPKYPKVVRRVYESPVYRPVNEYGPPKEPSTTYGLPNGVEETIKNPRIIHSGSSGSFFSPPSDSYSLPIQQSESFNEQNPYGTSQTSYGPPQVSYGVPSTNYGPAPMPQDVYGPPQNSYLPPRPPQQGYGTSGWNGYALPQLPALPTIDFSWPFALKLNFFTIAKILLKLVIFKMIVKFIAIICLLLFIPKLEMKKGDKDDDSESDDGRKIQTSYSALEQLNTLTANVLDAIEMYQNENQESKGREQCTNNRCRIARFLKSGETWTNQIALLKAYLLEERISEKENLIEKT